MLQEIATEMWSAGEMAENVARPSESLIRPLEAKTMTSTPKRPWFRFHLLTAVLMMVAGGAFLWLNIHVSPLYPDRASYETEPPVYYGFPAPSVRYEAVAYEPSDDGSQLYGLGANAYRLDWVGLPINLLTFSVTLLAVALASEFLIRRREGRKP